MDGGALEPNELVDGEHTAQVAIAALGRKLVATLGLKEATAFLRKAMIDEALARCSGSRRAAAMLLEVDRRYVQRLAAVPHDRDSEA